MKSLIERFYRSISLGNYRRFLAGKSCLPLQLWTRFSANYGHMVRAAPFGKRHNRPHRMKGVQVIELERASELPLDRIEQVLDRFIQWLEQYGETSWDYQTYFAGLIGGRAKGLYYRHKMLGTLAVAPMIFSEALVPSAR